MQKKAYKVLAYACEHRPAFLAAHFQDLLETVMAGGRAQAARLHAVPYTAAVTPRPRSPPAT